MKILALSNCLLDHSLGSGRTRLAWAEGLRHLGHEVTTLGNDQLLGGGEGPARGRRSRLVWRAWQWLRRHGVDQYDIIEFFGAEFWLATWLLSRRKTRPLLVAHTDGLELLMEERLGALERKRDAKDGSARRFARRVFAGLKSSLERLAFTRADGFVTASDADRAYLLRHGLRSPETMAVVLLGLEPIFLDRHWRNPRREEVCFLGSWIERKGVAPLVAVMTELLGERPNLRLHLFGTDSTAPAEMFPEELRGRVVVHPWLANEDIIAGLSAAKIFFFPTEYEGFGLALAEAMACGCAAVTTATGFGANLQDGQEALICPFGDTGAMKKAVRRLLEDEPFRARVAEAGWNRVQTLRWEISVRQLETTYLGWLEKKSAGVLRPS